MLKITLLLCLATTVVVAEDSLFTPDIDALYDEKSVLDHLLDLHRYRRQTEDTEDGDGSTDGPDVFEGGPPPPPPPGGRGDGPPPDGDGQGPPPDGDGQGPPRPHHGKGKWKPPKCCKMPKMADGKELKAAFKECLSTVPPPEHPKQRGCWKKPDGCLLECVFEKMGYHKDGKVDKDLIAAKVLPAMEKDEKNAAALKSMMEKAMDFCVQNATQEAASNTKCQSGSQEMAFCMMREIMMNCPAEAWKDNDKCNNMRKWMKEGPSKDIKDKFPRCEETATEAA